MRAVARRTASLRSFGSRRLLSNGPTERMNYFTAVNDAMRVALKTDDTAVVFGEVTSLLSFILLIALFNRMLPLVASFVVQLA
jgi:phosphoenolpyruvate carboxylase